MYVRSSISSRWMAKNYDLRLSKIVYAQALASVYVCMCVYKPHRSFLRWWNISKPHRARAVPNFRVMVRTIQPHTAQYLLTLRQRFWCHTTQHIRTNTNTHGTGTYSSPYTSLYTSWSRYNRGSAHVEVSNGKPFFDEHPSLLTTDPVCRQSEYLGTEALRARISRPFSSSTREFARRVPVS